MYNVYVCVGQALKCHISFGTLMNIITCMSHEVEIGEWKAALRESETGC